MRVKSILLYFIIMLHTAPLTGCGTAQSSDNLVVSIHQASINKDSIYAFGPTFDPATGVLNFHRNTEASQDGLPKRIVEHRLIRPQPDMHSIMSINPPTFRWPEKSKSANYQIEISSNSKFASPTKIQTKETFHRPLLPMESGHWWWRYREVNKSWSNSIEFDISEDLEKWPIPEWETLISRIPKQHPRIFLRPEDVQNYKYKSNGALEKLIKKWKKHLLNNDTIGKKSAKVSSALSKSHDAEIAQHRERKLAVSKARLFAGQIPDYCWLWMLTGEDRFAEKAKELTLTYTNIITLDPTQSNSDFSISTILSSIAIGYDMLQHMFSESEQIRIKNLLLEHARPSMKSLLSVPSKLFYNHGWQRTFLESMIVALALAGEETEADEWLEGGLRRFVAFYPWFGGADGGSAEGAGYFLSSDILGSMRIHDFFYNAFGIDFAQNNPWFRNSIYYMIYAYPPGGIKSMFGDIGVRNASSTPGGQTSVIARRMADLFNNGYAADYAARIGNSNNDNLFSDLARWLPFKDIQFKSIQELPNSKLFSDIGVAFMNSAITKPEYNVRLEFRSSPYGAYAHAHADQNSFNIIAGNKPLIVDSGYYDAYGSTHHKKWSTQTKAHNTLLIDGYGQDRKKSHDTRGFGRIVHFLDTNNFTYLMGSANTAYTDIALKRFDRHLVWLKGTKIQTYIIIDDIETSDNLKHNFDWVIHANHKMLIDQKRKIIVLSNSNATAKITFLDPIHLEISQDNLFTADPKAYQDHPAYKSLLPQWHLRARSTDKSSTHFVAVIQVTDSAQEIPDITETDVGFYVGEWGISINSDNVEVRPFNH